MLLSSFIYPGSKGEGENGYEASGYRTMLYAVAHLMGHRFVFNDQFVEC